MGTRRSLTRLALIASFVSALGLLAACGGGGGGATPTSGGANATSTVAGGVGGAAVTPVATTPTPAATSAGSATAAASAVASGTPGAAAMPLSITTSADTQYDSNELTAPAGTKVTLTYTNNSDLPHSWHLFDGDNASAPSIAATDIKAGPGATTSVTFTTPSTPGRYFFHCDVHPTQMQGFLVVQ